MAADGAHAPCADDRHGICLSASDSPAEVLGRRRECKLSHEFQSSPVVDDALSAAVDDSQWLRTLLELAPVAVVVEDQQGRVRSWNPEAERVFGWRADEVIGRNLPFGPDAERITYERRLQRVLEGGRVQADLDCVRSDGVRFAAAVLATPLLDRDGRVFGALSMYSDNSARKRAEGHTILQGVVTRALAEAESAD
ncbi:MAG: PAS domain S-box protein, partial [Betaproteobacteria bacterium]